MQNIISQMELAELNQNGKKMETNVGSWAEIQSVAISPSKQSSGRSNLNMPSLPMHSNTGSNR
jgi:hypothetical protein